MTLRIGNPLYMAPELLRSEQPSDDHEARLYDERVDVYAYAMFLYELWIDSRPWKERDEVKKFDLFRSDYVQLQWRILTEQCWDQDPSERP